MINIPLLKPEDIEVKVKQISKNGAVALLYKTARTDMEILDQVFGLDGWECSYEEVKGNLYCTITLHIDGRTVKKQDCGIESREDSEGNQKKGEASDAFKRAGFKVGIGRELYTAPFTFLPVPTEEKNGRWQLKNAFQRFEVSVIEYVDRKISKLVIIDSKTRNAVFSYDNGKTAKIKVEDDQPENEPENGSEATVTKVDKLPDTNNVCEYITNELHFMAELYGLDYKEMITRFAGMREKLISEKIIDDVESKSMTADQAKAMIEAVYAHFTQTGEFKP